jgi:hypothetical protein
VEPDDLKEHYDAGELFEELDGEPLIEQASQVIPARRGKLLQEDGSLRVSVIRPCISRGKKIRGLSPIYTPRMLAENAAVFTDWPMYEDHLMEEAVGNFSEDLIEANMGDLLEWLQERARKVKELGGRIERSFWNPDVTFEDDSAFGFQKGAVEAQVFPQPRILEMLEADPKILNVSINAYPSGARPGPVPWEAGKRGMLIEGIRRKPRGSVDWVFRGGAGGRLLLAEEDAGVAVSVLEAFYSAADGKGPLARETDLMKNLQDLKPGDLREFLAEEAPHLVEALAPEGDPPAAPTGGITEERLSELLQEQREEIEAALEERDDEVEERASQLVEERESLRTYQDRAFELLAEAQSNGLPKGWADDLKRRYTLLPSGPSSGLLNIQEEEREEDGKTVTLTELEVLEDRVRADVKRSAELIQEAGGNTGPLLEGLGGKAADGDEGPKAAPKQSAFRDFLRESGDIEAGEDAKPESEQIKEMVVEGASR